MKQKTFFCKQRVNYLHFLLVLLLTQNLHGQQPRSSFDSIFYHTVVNLASTDVSRAKEVADSLYRNSRLPLERVKALMLTVELEKNTGNMAGAIEKAIKAYAIADAHNQYEWQARICGFLSTQYRSVGLHGKGKKYLLLGLELNKSIADKRVALQLEGLAHQEMAYYHMEEKKYRKAVASLTKANACFSALPESAVVQCHIAASEEMMGRNYGFLQESDQALLHYRKALEYISCATSHETILKGFVYEGLARLYLERGDSPTALQYYKRALPIAESAGHLNLQVEVYRGLASCYSKNGDAQQYKRYNTNYQESLRRFIKVNKTTADQVVSVMQEREDRLLSDRGLLFWAVALCLALGIAYALVAKRKAKKNYERYKKIIKLIREKEQKVPFTAAAPALVQRADLISEEKERAILEKLALFEQGKGFLDKNISLSVLAGYTATNTKYLSHVINSHKKQDFNAYVNQLRVYYIIKRIESDPQYLQYKISYLAEESGFSSHSKFTTVFKNVTGMAPSVFLGFLERSQKKKALAWESRN